MRSKGIRIGAIVLAGLCAVVGPSLAMQLVVCAPGYPGDTEQAQPTMDRFAALLARGAGWDEGALSAVYHADLDEGRAAFEGTDTRLALVSYPFYYEHKDALGLLPLARASAGPGGERWSLVGPRERDDTAGTFAGWSLESVAGYAPRFVREVALAGAPLASEIEIRFQKRIVGALRSAASGEARLLLLDSKQSAALPKLPFAGELEVLRESEPVPSAVVCAVGARLEEKQAIALRGAFLDLSGTSDGAELLGEMMLEGFEAYGGGEP